MTITILTLSTILACVTLMAQETPRPAGGGLAERFKQLDKNGDGKLSAEEVAVMPSLSRLLPVADKDKDGALSRDEIRAASAQWPTLAGLIGETAKAKSKRVATPRNNAPIDPKWGPDVEPKETTLKFKFAPDYPARGPARRDG